jgi:thiamine kinase-like enzyme
MLFNEFALCHYLLENGFLNQQQVVDNQIKITRHFSLNRNFKILFDDDSGYLVKQPKLSFYRKKSSLKKEADVYWLAYNDEDFRSIRNFIPQFHHFDVHVQVLITGLVEQAVNLHDYHSVTNNYPEKIAMRQAEILAALHNITLVKIQNKRSSSLFPKKLNWMFNVEKEDEWWAGKKSEADLQLLNLVKANVDFIQCINAAKQKWEIKCLIHNDIRWTNFLMRGHELDSLNIRLIDWELADFGDPCWDVAGILQSYFSYWILQRDANLFQLLNMKPAISAFTNTYCELMKMSKAEIDIMLQKSMEFAGVRMIQSCMEMVSFNNELSQNSVKLLQFAFNVLKNPEEAFHDFLESRKNQV